jgi:RNA polymerase sigma-70 factor (ECF subfamily)
MTLVSAREPAAEPATQPPDRTTVEAALAGDEPAFEALIRVYGRRVFAVAFAVVQDVAEAEDIVQDTFLKLHEGRTRDAGNLPAWLTTVARNAARDRLRRRKPQAGEDEFHTLADDRAARPGVDLQRREYSERLRRALGSLPEEHRTALTLRYLEGLDYRSIAHEMGVTDGALRGMLGRALGTLRRNPALAQERP